ncbi:MAG: flagellar hook-associated protein FlgL [Candidatus Latescibacteria bacterium]|jgi:flagellar hook-associated protein 3 FlgL|nr:flagellar hook-associated protein FlgL [Candidatus Latescibacterota bacterium]
MRVTDKILRTNFLSNLALISERLYNAETKVLTNKSINKPSDNPVDTINALAIRTRLDEIKQYQRNMSRIKNMILNTETVVTQLSDMFQRVTALVVQGASDSYGPSDRLSISNEVNQLLEQVFNAANTKSEAIYVFGGTNNNIKPYSETRNAQGDITEVKTYGSGGDIMSVMGEGITVKANINGEDLFERGDNIFDVLINIRDDLQSGDSDSLREDLNVVHDVSEKIVNTLAVLGARTNRVEAAETRAINNEVNFTGFLSDTEDVDAGDAIINYQTELMALQASLQVGAKLMQPRLIDFLR